MAEQSKQEKKEATQAESKVLEVSSSPHLQDDSTSRRVMLEVAIGTLPAVIMAIYLFRTSAIVVLLSCLVGGMGTEWIFNAVRKKRQTILDGSALVTCLILALSLPPTFPWWGCVIGSVVGIGVAKMLFGGLGSNIFNPAMVGRAFLMACFGTMMTTWTAPVIQTTTADNGSASAVVSRCDPNACCKVTGGACVCKASGKPGCGSEVAAVTQATPLALAKQAVKTNAKLQEMNREIETLEQEGVFSDDLKQEYDKTRRDQKARLANLNGNKQELFLGTISGSVGETSALLWLLGGLFLLWRRTITFHIPLAVLASALVLATGAWLIDSEVYPDPLVHLCGGGLMMCAFFIATDPVSCPLSKRGRVIFGIGVGVLVMLIRLIGGYPEGVMYAVLLMNSMTPLLDRWTRPTPLGGHVKKE